MGARRTLVLFVAGLVLAAGIGAAIWMAGRGRTSLGPEARREGSASPMPATAVAFATGTPDPGATILLARDGQLTQISNARPYASIVPLGDGSFLAGDAETRSWRVVYRDGTAEPRLPLYWPTKPAPSRDERRLAWPGERAIEVYDRRTGELRDTGAGQWVVGRLAWSPDDQRIAYLRLTGDTVVHLVTLDVATGGERELYAGAPGDTIGDLRWTDDHEITFRLYRSPRCCALAAGQIVVPGEGEGGERYAIGEDGGAPRLLSEGNALWHLCGPPCGLPPAGDERDDGVLTWAFETGPGGFTMFRWGIADRAAGVVRVMPGAESSGAGVVSPDGTRVAYVTCDFVTPQVLRVVRLADTRVEDVALPAWANANRVCFNVQWFPGGEELLLSFASDQ